MNILDPLVQVLTTIFNAMYGYTLLTIAVIAAYFAVMCLIFYYLRK